MILPNTSSASSPDGGAIALDPKTVPVAREGVSRTPAPTYQQTTATRGICLLIATEFLNSGGFQMQT